MPVPEEVRDAYTKEGAQSSSLDGGTHQPAYDSIRVYEKAIRLY